MAKSFFTTVARAGVGVFTLLLFQGTFSVASADNRSDGISYPLICRAGEANSFIMIPGDKKIDVIFSFKKAEHGFIVDPAGIQPGECAWEDRAVSEGEPDKAFFTVHNGAGDRQFSGAVAVDPRAWAKFGKRERKPIAVQIMRSSVGTSTGTQILIQEPKWSEMSEVGFPVLDIIDFKDGELFTVFAQRRSHRPSGKEFLFISSIYDDGGQLTDGRTLQFNENGDVTIIRARR